MKFNKSKPWILHLGQGNPGYVYSLWDESLESNLMERDLGMLADSKGTAVCPGSPKGQLHPGVHHAQHCHREKGGVVLLCSLGTATGPEGTAWSCVRGGIRGGRDRICTREWWAWNRLPGAAGTAPSAGVQGVFGHHYHRIGFWMILHGTRSWT